MTEADLTAIEERNTRAIGFNHHALTDIPRLLSEVRSLQALERTAWADYQACAAERDRLTLDLHSARQLVTDTHAALEQAEARVAELEAALTWAAWLGPGTPARGITELRFHKLVAEAAANHRARVAGQGVPS